MILVSSTQVPNFQKLFVLLTIINFIFSELLLDLFDLVIRLIITFTIRTLYSSIICVRRKVHHNIGSITATAKSVVKYLSMTESHYR